MPAVEFGADSLYIECDRVPPTPDPTVTRVCEWINVSMYYYKSDTW